MELKVISIAEYKEKINSLHSVIFQQSDYHAKKFENDGWNVEFIEAVDGFNTFALAMLAYIPLMKVFKYCYIPRGFIADYHDLDKIQSFISELKGYLKAKNVVYLETDPEIDLQERDKDGNIVENGYKNFDIVENLKNSGFIQLPLKQGYDLSKECRWCSVLDLRNKSKDDIFKEFSYSTRQDIRGSEKYCVKVRELDVDELDILDSMEKETSKRHDFESFSLKYYKELYSCYGNRHVKTLYAYLDIDEYGNKIQSEFDKTKKNIENVKKFLSENPGNIKKEKRLKTDEEYFNSLSKKITQISDLKKQFNNEVPLACCLFLKYSNQIIYLVGASNYDQRIFKGPYAIQWHMIQEAIEEGYDFYNFYGISGYFEKGQEGYGVFDYKRGYNALVHEYIGNFILPCKPIVFSFYNKLKKVV